MPTGEVLAVKVLASNSKQGEKEFQTEVLHCNTCTRVYAEHIITARDAFLALLRKPSHSTLTDLIVLGPFFFYILKYNL
jgi:hypothetical protein